MVEQKMTASKEREMTPLFRFGMTFKMPLDYDTIEFYGRGPHENYSDRNNSSKIGIYRQSVEEQFYPYIRPQENGNKTDLRWWKMINKGGFGFGFHSDKPLSASALYYSMDSLDDGWQKDQRHSPEVKKTDYVNVCIDKVQMGLGCIDSWGAWPRWEYMIPYQDHTFTFIISPVKDSYEMHF